MTTILAGGRPLTLLPEKAAFIAASATLLVADAHIGKAVSFRALGVPVPRGTTSETLAGLSALVRRTGARRIVFLGDFLHSAARACAGHARRGGRLARRAPLARSGAGARQPRRPRRRPAGGARHPGRRRAAARRTASPSATTPGRSPASTCWRATCTPASASVGGWDHLCLPCFWFGDAVGVLPAFGAFTGMHPVCSGAEDRLFAVADNVVAAMPVASERFAA